MGCLLNCIPLSNQALLPSFLHVFLPVLKNYVHDFVPTSTIGVFVIVALKIVMLIPSSLKIEHYDNTEVWQREEDESETRFGEVVRALGVTWLQIDASINFGRLSANTDYAAYLIYKTKADSVGLDASLEATISVGQNQLMKKVCIKPSRVGVPRNTRRPDSWMEMELGQFRVDDDTGKADISLKETTVWKTGLTIAGIEVRPV